MNNLSKIVFGMSFLFLTACSNNAPVVNKQAGTMTKESVATVQKATVTSVKQVSIMGKRGNGVRTVGSITGSIVGSAVPYAGSIIGSLLGGAMGGEADKAISKQAGLEIGLQLSNGEKVTVTQLANINFKTGDKVQLIMRDNKAQVAHLQDNS